VLRRRSSWPPAAVDRHLLPVRSSAANPPLLRSNDVTDRQTLNRFIDPAPRTMRTVAQRQYSPQSVASLPALGRALGTPPAERGPSLESIHRVSLTVDLCETNKIISFKKFISPQPVGGPSKRKKSGGLGTCPVCRLVKTAVTTVYPIFQIFSQ